MVQISRLAPQHWVADVIETAEFYRDVLGFSFTSFFGDPPGFVILDRDGVRLLFRSGRGRAQHRPDRGHRARLAPA